MRRKPVQGSLVAAQLTEEEKNKIGQMMAEHGIARLNKLTKLSAAVRSASQQEEKSRLGC